jgi:hypothetical protein
LAVSAPVEACPLVGWTPAQAPEAWQLVALVADQFKVALPPLVTAVGPTLNTTTGSGDLIETVADCVAVPPGPVQLSV